MRRVVRGRCAFMRAVELLLSPKHVRFRQGSRRFNEGILHCRLWVTLVSSAAAPSVRLASLGPSFLELKGPLPRLGVLLRGAPSPCKHRSSWFRVP